MFEIVTYLAAAILSATVRWSGTLKVVLRLKYSAGWASARYTQRKSARSLYSRKSWASEPPRTQACWSGGIRERIRLYVYFEDLYRWYHIVCLPIGTFDKLPWVDPAVITRRE